MADKALFDDWPERYDEWFATPIGRLVKDTESRLILDFLRPDEGETILDAGCGTGVFTIDFLRAGALVVGLDLSKSMLEAALRKTAGYPFVPVLGDMLALPFPDAAFDKTVSVTALEFIAQGPKAVGELFRVTKPGGLVVVATLNNLSPWAERRNAKTKRGQRHVLAGAVYRSPEEVLDLGPAGGTAATAVHFQKDDPVEEAAKLERRGQEQGLPTGAMAVVKWRKPAWNRRVM